MTARGSDPEHAVSHLSPLHCARTKPDNKYQCGANAISLKCLFDDRTLFGSFFIQIRPKMTHFDPPGPHFGPPPSKIGPGGAFLPKLSESWPKFNMKFLRGKWPIFRFPGPPPGSGSKSGQKCPKTWGISREMPKNDQKWPKMAKNGSFLTLFGAQISN